MRYLRTLFLFLSSFFIICGCSCGSGAGRGGAFRIGIDPNWYPVNFGPQQPFVNGFVEDLLLEVSRYTGIEFEKIPANWDSLLGGLRTGKYDAVLSSLPPYDYNLAAYDFSSNFLDLGPVLIVAANNTNSELSKMKGEYVGLVTGDPAAVLLNHYPDLIVRNFPTIPDLLNGIASGEAAAGLLNQIPAASYVRDLYAKELKISGKPMTDAGLHLLTLKGSHSHFLRQFDRALEQMKKKNKFQALSTKWQLAAGDS